LFREVEFGDRDGLSPFSQVENGLTRAFDPNDEVMEWLRRALRESHADAIGPW
jgi:hypothetical protein